MVTATTKIFAVTEEAYVRSQTMTGSGRGSRNSQRQAKTDQKQLELNALQARMTNFEKQMNETIADFKNTITQTETRPMTNDTTTEEQKVKHTENTSLMSKFEDFVKHVNANMKAMQNDIETVKKSQQGIENKIDSQEQYSRRNCVLIHGIEEQHNEDPYKLVVEILNEKLSVNISTNDISRCHRIGSQRDKTNKKRPLIVKFISYQTKDKVWRRKRSLKDTNILITESLTAKRMDLLRSTQAMIGHRNCWTQDGEIILIQNDKRHRVSSSEDLSKLINQIALQ